MPVLRIHLDRIMENINKINEINKKLGNSEILIVTKVLLSNKNFVSKLAENGIKSIGDTKLKNLKELEQIDIKKMLMAIALSDVVSDLEKVDIIYATEISVLKKISESGFSKKLDVMIPIELGELREGVTTNEIFDFIEESAKLSGINIIGIAGNFGCLSGLVPDKNHFETLIWIKEELKKKKGISLKYISVGGSVLMDDFIEGKIPKEINHFRFGEGVILGYNTSLKKHIDSMNQGNFIVEGEIIEIREKNTDVSGEFAYNAFGDKQHFRNRIINKGLRKRAVLNFGFLSSILHSIKPVNSKIEVVANSHDHTVVDITDFKEAMKVGDKIEFYANYDMVCFAMMSDNFIKKFE